MSWVFNREKTSLVNLDHVEALDIRDYASDETPSCVFADMGKEDSDGDAVGHVLFVGTEEACKDFLLGLAGKVPLLRI